jgi:RimJ/RimL family protein N-acetyltransferase
VRHSLEIDGSAFRLRPVRLEDAAFIVELRSDPERGRYLHRGCTGTSSQEEWLRKYFKTPGDFYFIIENRFSGTREGTAGIYNVDPTHRGAECGRWILRRGSLAAVESACLVYRLGFEQLALDALYCRTIAENASALAFHDSFGVERVCRLPRYFEWEGRPLDAIEGRLTRRRWLGMRDAMEAKAARAASWTASASAAATS